MQNKVRSFQKILRGISFVGQLGFLIITPPLVLLYLADFLQTRFGWGVWVSVAAILVGILSALSSAYRFITRMMTASKKDKAEEKTTSFNEHS